MSNKYLILKIIHTCSGNQKNLIIQVPVGKIISNALGAQANFSTTKQLFSSSSDPKK